MFTATSCPHQQLRSLSRMIGSGTNSVSWYVQSVQIEYKLLCLILHPFCLLEVSEVLDPFFLSEIATLENANARNIQHYRLYYYHHQE